MQVCVIQLIAPKGLIFKNSKQGALIYIVKKKCIGNK